MKKIIVSILAFMMLFVLGIYVIESPSNQSSPKINTTMKAVVTKAVEIESQPDLTVDSLTIVETKSEIQPESGEILRDKDGRMVVKGVLPPELRNLNKNLNEIDKQLETVILQESKKNELKDMQQLIQETDDLITTTNQRLGISSPSL